MPKFNSFKTFAAVMMAASLGALTSCTDYTEFSEAEIRDMEQLKKYTELFEARFGKIDPNHTWGMDEEIGCIEAFSNAASDKIVTRAGTESTESRVLVNRNEWTMFHIKGTKHPYTYPNHDGNSVDPVVVQIPDYNEDALAHDIQIPGYPHLNGLYYTANGNTLDPNYKTGNQITSGMIPAGDITPYEIQYVSNWFRTNKNPESIKLHLSDFFIQNVSCDYDQVSYATSGYEPYKTSEDGENFVEWPSTGNNGKNIGTKNEAIYADDAHTLRRQGYDKENRLVNYAENLKENINYDLDYLGFKDMDGKWTHVNNFNRGNSNFSPEDNKSNPNREIKYVKSAGTEDFECRSSWSNSGHEYESKWVLVHLKWNETVKHANSPYTPGTVIPREGYYLAFDFAGGKGTGNDEQIVHRDGYYSNWIIKITPGHFNPAGNSKRIFCEDLGATDDTDFNDAVIDVAFEHFTYGDHAGKYQPIITVQATGATLPIYVEHKSGDYELHKMLGSDNTTTMINVAAPGNTIHPVATYRGEYYDQSNAGQISIWANGKQINGIAADANENERTNNIGNYGDKITLAPMAFSTPTTVMWMKERNSIDLGYPKFSDWVGDSNWKDKDTNKKWYEMIDPENVDAVYPFVANENDGPVSPGVNDESLEWSPIAPDPTQATVDVVSTVNADSYMKLNGYTQSDAIITRLNSMGDNDRVTFTVVLSSNTKYVERNDQGNVVPLEGILVPADINNGSLSNNGHEFTTAGMSRFTSAAYVPNDNISDKDYSDPYTYTLQFSFAKSDILRSSGGYHDYLLLYLKVGGNTNTVGSGNTIGVNNGVTVRKWFVHY